MGNLQKLEVLNLENNKLEGRFFSFRAGQSQLTIPVFNSFLRLSIKSIWPPIRASTNPRMHFLSILADAQAAKKSLKYQLPDCNITV